MPKRISRDGSIVEPHAIKLEEMYDTIFDWFKDKKNISKTDVIRNAVELYYLKISMLNPDDLSKADLRTRTQKNIVKSKLIKEELKDCKKELKRVRKAIAAILKEGGNIKERFERILARADSVDNPIVEKLKSNEKDSPDELESKDNPDSQK